MHDSLILWFYVVESLLLPIALYVTDPLFKEAVKQSFRRRSSKYAADYKAGKKPLLRPLDHCCSHCFNCPTTGLVAGNDHMFARFCKH